MKRSAIRERLIRWHGCPRITRPQKRGRSIRATLTLLLFASTTCATAQTFDLAASGFAIAPPTGYVAGRGVPSSPSHVVVSLTKPAELGTGCEVSFEALPGFEQFSQDALNRQTDNPNWDAFYRDGLGEFYAVRSVERFDHAGVRGAVVHGVTKPRPATRGWAADVPTLIFLFYTPKGLNKIACVADTAVFDARRTEFEMVVRGVRLAR